MATALLVLNVITNITWYLFTVHALHTLERMEET